MIALGVARQQFVERDVAAQCRRGGQAPGRRIHLAFDRGRADQLVVEAAFLIEQADEGGGQILDGCLPGRGSRSTCAHGRGQQSVRFRSAAAARPAPAEARRRATWTSARASSRGRSSKCKQALAEPVAAASAGDDQRHGRSGDRAIAVADQPLDDTGLAPADARLRAGGDPLLVGAAQKQPHQARSVEQAGRRTIASISARLPSSFAGDRDVRQSGAEARRRCRRPGSAASPSSAPAPARSGASAELRKKSTRTVDSRSPPARRAGAFWSAAEAAIGHSSGIICADDYRICVNFPSTRLRMADVLDDEKETRGVERASRRDKPSTPRESERDRGDDRASAGK